MKIAAFTLALCGTTLGVFAQDDPCLAWTSFPSQDENAAMEAHMFYRDKVKVQDYEGAFPLWQKAYEMAPAADGQRPFHYTDGRTIYLDKYAKATTDAEKNEYAAMIVKLYEQERECYPGNEAQSLSLQVYDMFYSMQRPYTETYPVALEAMNKGGDKTDFRVITPVGYLVPYMYTNDHIDAEEARRVIEQSRGIVAANQDGPTAADYTAAQEAADKSIVQIERNVFDCDYFKAKLEPEYRADPNTPETWKSVYTQLLQVGCSKEDPLLAEIGTKDRAYEQKRYEENNPLAAAKKMIKEGDIEGAMTKLEETADASTGDQKAAILLNMASLYRTEMKSSSKAREYARKAAAAKPGWGKPYIMIGDLYASSSRSCSDDPFKQRLVVIAAIEQYSRAKSDPETAGEAQRRINKYSGSLPTKEMLFERGIKSGESQSTGCWIGETVTVRAS